MIPRPTRFCCLPHRSCARAASLSLFLASTVLVAGEDPVVTESYAVEEARFEGPLSLAPWGHLVFRVKGGGTIRSGIDAEIPACGAPVQEPRATPAPPDERSRPSPGSWAPGSLEELPELIREVLGYDDHDEERARVEVLRGLIRITADRTLQAGVRKLVEAVAAMATAEIAVECAMVPVEVLDAAVPDWASRGPIVPDEAFEQALLDERTELVRLTARPGRRVAATVLESLPVLSDQEVNQTGVIPVNNPVVATVPSGMKVELRAALLEGGERVWLRLVAGKFSGSFRDFDPGEAAFGTLELPTVDQTLLATTLTLPPGKVVLAGLSEARGSGLGSPEAGGGLAVLLRASPRQPVPGPDPIPLGDGSIWVAAIPELGSLDDRLWRPTVEDRPLGETLEVCMTRAGLQDDDQPFGWRVYRGGTLAVWGNHEKVAKMRRAVTEVADRARRTLSVVLEIWDLPRAKALDLVRSAEGGRLLPADWKRQIPAEGAARRRRFAATGTDGEVLALFDADVATYLVGSSQVSGGTGFAIVERSDPETTTCGSGTELWLRAQIPGDGRARLRLEGVDARVEGTRKVVAAFPVQVSGAGGVSPMATRAVTLELPSQRVAHWTADVDLPLDRDAVVEARIEGERGTLLTARVRELR